MTHTVQLYKLGHIEKILISGGTGLLLSDEDPEADRFKKVMLLMEVPEEDILLENKTRNTYESAVEIKKIADSLGYRDEDCIVVTSAFHMRRSLACFRKAGFHPENFSGDPYAHPRNFYPDSMFLSQLEAWIVWHKLAKEWTGVIAYKLAGYI